MKASIPALLFTLLFLVQAVQADDANSGSGQTGAVAQNDSGQVTATAQPIAVDTGAPQTGGDENTGNPGPNASQDANVGTSQSAADMNASDANATAHDLNAAPSQNADSGGIQLDQNAPAVVDMNAAQEIGSGSQPSGGTQDENAPDANGGAPAGGVVVPAPTGEPKITFVAPLHKQVVGGVQVIIVAIENIVGITRQLFQLGDSNAGATVNGGTITGDINTERFPDGGYDLKALLCNDYNCYSGAVRVTVMNDLNRRDQKVSVLPEPELVLAPRYSVRPSNALAAMTILDENGNVLDSSTEEVLLGQGRYSAKMTFIEGAITEVYLRDIAIDGNAVLVEVDQNVPAKILAPEKKLKWRGIVAVKPGVNFSSGEVTLKVPRGADFLYKCAEWDFSGRGCAGEWALVEKVRGSPEVTVKIAMQDPAFGFAKVPTKGLKAKVKNLKREFRQEESPTAEFSVEDENGTAEDRDMRLFLDGPSGRNEITGLLERTREGKFRVKLKGERQFRAGVYKLVTQIEDDEGVVESEQQFQWGLVSLNTKKSIYRSGETAEFIIVVLDQFGAGLCGADIRMAVMDPDGRPERYSTEKGTILGREGDCGIYEAGYPTKTEGVHSISLSANGAGVMSTFDTNFLVKQNYDFDIVRTADSKIDPTKTNSFRVRIDIAAFNGAGSVTLKEYLPPSFTNVASDGVAMDANGAKVLTWSRTLDGGKAFAEYTYSVPLIWPQLYELGEAEVVHADGTFTEARHWYVAVDPPITTTAFHLRDDSDYNIANQHPRPDDTVTGDTYQDSLTVRIYAMHPYMTSLASIVGKDNNGVSFRSTGSTAGNRKAAMVVSPALAAQTISANTWTARFWRKENTTSDNLRPRQSLHIWADANDSKSSTIKNPVGEVEPGTTLGLGTISITGTNTVVAAKKDKLIWQIDWNTNATTTTPEGDYNFNTTNRDANIVFSGTAIQLYSQLKVPQILTPGADANSSVPTNTNFRVDANSMCDGNYFDCGRVDMNAQWCAGAGCSNWADANSASGAIQLVSGTNPSIDPNMPLGDGNVTAWVLKATVDGTYELRILSDGNVTDVNTSSGTDRTMTFTGGAADYSFTLNLPSSGCTQGKGSIDAGTSCDKGYFEATDLGGNADNNKVDPEGQTSTLPLFSYDNQSTTSSDLNIRIDINQAIPSYLNLKVSKIYNGWAWECTGNTDNNCVKVSISFQNIGKAVYSAGTQDLNIFVWGDFNGATVGQVDRNTTSESLAP